MAEPTSAYTVQDLILRVAKAAGVAYYGSSGTGIAAVPVDEHDLERCLDCVNDGIKMFISSAPKNGWRWMQRLQEITFGTVQTTGTCDSAGDATSLIDSSLASTYDTDDEIVGYYVYDTTQEIYAAVTAYTAATGDITVSEWLDYDDNSSSLTPASGDSYSITDVQTVDGDKARYPLNQDFFGEVCGDITYVPDSSRVRIYWVGEDHIRRLQEVTVLDSYPNMAAVRPWQNRRWELVVNPSPNSADTVTFHYKKGFAAMQAVTGEASAGDATSITCSDIADLYPDNYFNGWTVYIIGGTGRKSYAEVTDYDGGTGAFTVADWLSVDGSAGGTDPDATSEFFVTDGTRHPAGQQFDEAILSACLAKAELEFEDLQVGYMQKFLQVDLPRAWDIDARSAPKKLGKMMPGKREHLERTWNDVTIS